MIVEQLDPMTGDLLLVGATRTVRVRRVDIAALGKQRAIQEAVTRAWRTERMIQQMSHQMDDAVNEAFRTGRPPGPPDPV